MCLKYQNRRFLVVLYCFVDALRNFVVALRKTFAIHYPIQTRLRLFHKTSFVHPLYIFVNSLTEDLPIMLVCSIGSNLFTLSGRRSLDTGRDAGDRLLLSSQFLEAMLRMMSGLFPNGKDWSAGLRYWYSWKEDFFLVSISYFTCFFAVLILGR